MPPTLFHRRSLYDALPPPGQNISCSHTSGAIHRRGLAFAAAVALCVSVLCAAVAFSSQTRNTGNGQDNIRGSSGGTASVYLEKGAAGSSDRTGPLNFREADREDGATFPLDEGGVGAGTLIVNVWRLYGTDVQELELYPWEHLAEPHGRTIMEVAMSSREDLGDRVEFRWEVAGAMVGTGTSMEAVFAAPGTYKCSVYAYPRVEDGDGTEEGEARTHDSGRTAPHAREPTDEVLAKHSFEVTVKYVRREIRSLTDRDREAFFNAVSVLQRVPSAVGRQIYGDRYYSKDYFNRLHLYYGGRQDCDHWHDGAGFVTSHIAVSLMFEQALQAVNPTVSLPYWDFTIEGSQYDWTNFRTSSVFADDWFGSAAPRNSFRTPDRGRFAYVPAMTNAAEYSDVYNAYGLLRSPWNTDPVPFLTRHDHISGYMNNRKPAGCKQYRDAIREDTWMALTVAMNLGAHGHIHELLGGTWSQDWSRFDERTTKRVFPFMHNIVPYMKYIWRSGYLECPESCTSDLPWRECRCTCPESSQVPPSQVLEEAGLLSPDVGTFFYDKDLQLVDNLGNDEGLAYESIPGYTEEETREIYNELLSVLCTPMKVGTHYEGTSTNDITFWVLHPTFDRLWHLRRLQDDPMFNETWIGDHSCYGHNPGDVQPFFDLFVGPDDTDKDSYDQESRPGRLYYSNSELYHLLRPNGQEIPYVYDSFDWTHCDATGVHIRGDRWS